MNITGPYIGLIVAATVPGILSMMRIAPIAPGEEIGR